MTRSSGELCAGAIICNDRWCCEREEEFSINALGNGLGGEGETDMPSHTCASLAYRSGKQPGKIASGDDGCAGFAE